MEEKSKKKNFGLIIILVLVAIIGVETYVIFSRNFKEKANENTSSESQLVETEYDKVAAKELVGKYTNMRYYGFSDLAKEKLSDGIKLSMAISSIASDKEVLCEEAFTVVLDAAGTRYYIDPIETINRGCYKGNSLKSYSYDLVNAKYNELFGENAPKVASYSYEYNYSEKINSYVELELWSSGWSVDLLYDVVSAKVDGNNLIIDIYYLDYYPQGDKYYAVNIEFDSMDNLNKYYTSNIDKLPHMTFNFVKNNGNYVLESIN